LVSIRYIKTVHEVCGLGGRKIIIERSKNGSECPIPISNKLKASLAETTPRFINQDLTQIGKPIGFAHKLTTKTSQKTPGTEWLFNPSDKSLFRP
jgi:hypothetical protein